MALWRALWRGEIEWEDTGTGEITVRKESRRKIWRIYIWGRRTWPIKHWWGTRPWRVLVTLPCGCPILKNCKRPYVCSECLFREFKRRSPD